MTDSGMCTFVAAAQEANAWDLHDTIVLGNGTYDSPHVLLSQDVTIEGVDAISSALKGNDFSRVLRLVNASSPGFKAVLRDVSINNGHARGGYGGGIYNEADLTLERVIVHSNVAQYGGGIANYGVGALTVEDSAIISNTAQFQVSPGSFNGYGGGVYNEASSGVTIQNSTISGNEAYNDGGGVYHNGIRTLRLLHATVANNNTTTGNGGGIYKSFPLSTFELKNSVIGDNSAGGSDPDCYGTFSTSNSENIIEVLSPNCTANGVNSGEALLEPLADNGGHTFTHALDSRSNAINAGDATACLLADQRGFARDASCDLGAYEAASTCTAPDLVGLSVELLSTDVALSWTDVSPEYEVWWDDAMPYFAPGVDCAGAGNCTVRTTPDHTDFGVVGAVGSRFYAVASVAACGDLSDPARVGMVSFEIVPGD
jgi:hypothetical protein